MNRPTWHRLGDLQLRIMQALWARREGSVADVLNALRPKASLAYTTVATMLRKMETRGLVAHRTDGRTYIYRPLVGADAVTRGMAEHLLDRLFQGSLTNLVSHLLTAREVSPEELSRLEKLIADRKKKP